MIIYAYTQKGTNKAENEDRIVVGKSIIAEGEFVCEMGEGFVAVADGVGGNNAGNIASHFVANEICQLRIFSNESFSQINNDLLELSESRIEYKGMATTLSGCYVTKERVILFHIGNTRVYLLQNEKYLKQLTDDDTTLNYLIKTRRIYEQDIGRFNRKNEITSCFGGGNKNIFNIKYQHLLQINSPLLITSDGVHDYLTVDQIEDIIADYGIGLKTCKRFAEEAQRYGSKDDISVVLCN